MAKKRNKDFKTRKLYTYPTFVNENREELNEELRKVLLEWENNNPPMIYNGQPAYTIEHNYIDSKVFIVISFDLSLRPRPQFLLGSCQAEAEVLKTLLKVLKGAIKEMDRYRQ